MSGHSVAIIRIRQLVQARKQPVSLLRGQEMNRLPVIENAYLTVENGIITGFGKMEDFPGGQYDEIIDATERLVLPAWIDSHTHTVFPASRYDEFIDKIRGLTYEEIAAKGGGILNSAKKLQQKSEEELLENALRQIRQMMRYGTGALEIKSGYGLSVEGELKMLRVIKKLKNILPIPVKATFLGAHAVPENMTNKDYINLIINEMLPEIAKQNLADYMDVFCEKNYFSPDDTAQLLSAARKYGLKPKIHVNQFTSSGGIKVAVEHGAVSVDHLEVMTGEDLATLEKSTAIATVLPGCSFFLNIPYAPAKEMIRRNIPVAVATDFNPGSAPSWNMNFMVSLACIKQKLTPEQAINAATVNAAAAIEISQAAGQIAVGYPARLIISVPLNHYGEIPYYFGTNPVEKTVGFSASEIPEL